MNKKYIFTLFRIISFFLLFVSCDFDTDNEDEEIINNEPSIYYGDVRLRSQLEVNNFDTNNYVEITGNLYIGGGGENFSINNLGPLYKLKKVGGNVDINSVNYLPNLNGMGNVTSIGGYLRIRNNDLLNSLDRMSLSSINNLWIEHNLLIPNLNGLENISSVNNIHIIGNNSLSNLEGLNNLTTINDLEIISNPILTDLDVFNQISSINNLNITNNDLLTTLDFFEYLSSLNSLKICGNDSLNNIPNLNINSISDLIICENSILQNIDLTTISNIIGSLKIYYNPLLESINLNNLESIGYYFNVFHNDLLTNLDNFENLKQTNRLRIAFNYSLDNLCGLQNINEEPISWIIDGNSFNPSFQDIIDGNCSN